MELFPLIKLMFKPTKDFDEVSNTVKAKNAFMINRRMAIKYPIISNQLNCLGINSTNVVNSWRLTAKKHTNMPGWLFTKTKSNKVEKPWEPSPEAAEYFMKINKISNRELKEAIEFNPEKMKAYFKKLAQYMKTTNA